MTHGSQRVEAKLGWNKSPDTGMHEQKVLSYNGYYYAKGVSKGQIEDSTNRRDLE